MPCGFAFPQVRTAHRPAVGLEVHGSEGGAGAASGTAGPGPRYGDEGFGRATFGVRRDVHLRRVWVSAVVSGWRLSRFALDWAVEPLSYPRILPRVTVWKTRKNRRFLGLPEVAPRKSRHITSLLEYPLPFRPAVDDNGAEPRLVNGSPRSACRVVSRCVLVLR